MPPTVLIVLPTHTYRAQAFLNAAGRAGIDVAVTSDEASTLGARRPGGELVVDLGRPEDAGAAALAFAARHPIDGVVGVDETAILTAAHVAAALGLRHHPAAAVAATRDKRRLRAVLEAARLPQPAWAEIATRAAPTMVRAAVAAVGGYPVVVKPVDLSGSRGVMRVDDDGMLGDAVRRLDALLDRIGCIAGAEGHPALVERFVPGAEVAVEAMAVGGRVHVLAVFDKPDPLDGPAFAETIYTTPSRHAPATLAQLMALTVVAARALGLTDGPIHAELRIPPAGPTLIEVAARSIGGLCSRTLRLGPGGTWSLEELIVRHAVGSPIDEGDLLVCGPPSGVLMLPVPRTGTLRRIGGVESAAAVPGIDGVSIAVPPGTAVEALPEGDRYLGFVFARRPTPLEVEIALRAARDRLRVEVEA